MADDGLTLTSRVNLHWCQCVVRCVGGGTAHRDTGDDGCRNGHCKTNGAGNSYPGFAVYVRHIVPLWLETISTFSFYVKYIVPLWLENHTMVIHLCEVYCTVGV